MKKKLCYSQLALLAFVIISGQSAFCADNLFDFEGDYYNSSGAKLRIEALTWTDSSVTKAADVRVWFEDTPYLSSRAYENGIQSIVLHRKNLTTVHQMMIQEDRFIPSIVELEFKPLNGEKLQWQSIRHHEKFRYLVSKTSDGSEKVIEVFSFENEKLAKNISKYFKNSRLIVPGEIESNRKILEKIQFPVEATFPVGRFGIADNMNVTLEKDPSDETHSVLTIGQNYHKGRNRMTIHDSNLYVEDMGNGRIRVVGLGAVSIDSLAFFSYPSAVVLDFQDGELTLVRESLRDGINFGFPDDAGDSSSLLYEFNEKNIWSLKAEARGGR